MKKLLLSAVLLSASFAGAQVLDYQDFNSLTLGDVGTDILGETPGQAGFYTAATNGADPTTSTNAGNSNFQIVADGFEGSGLMITGPDGNKGNRFMWQDGLVDLWATRTEGNEIIEVEYDLYTGPASASTGQVGIRLYGTDDIVTRVLNGFVFNVGTKVLQGVAYLNNAGTFNTFLINLAAAPGLVLDADTWYRIGFSYDTTTGETIWKASTVYTGLPEANWAGPFPVEEIDYVFAVPNTNAEAVAVTFDNVMVEATPEEALLGTGEVILPSEFSIYPNPAVNFINIANTQNVNSVVIADMNGRTVKSASFENRTEVQMNISDLARGIYMMTVSSDNGSMTKKIVKQ